MARALPGPRRRMSGAGSAAAGSRCWPVSGAATCGEWTVQHMVRISGRIGRQPASSAGMPVGPRFKLAPARVPVQSARDARGATARHMDTGRVCTHQLADERLIALSDSGLEEELVRLGLLDVDDNHGGKRCCWAQASWCCAEATATAGRVTCGCGARTFRTVWLHHQLPGSIACWCDLISAQCAWPSRSTAAIARP